MSLFTYKNSGRRPRNLIIVAGIWLCVLLAVVVLNMAPWLAVIVLAVTLPAIWEYLSGRQSALRIHATEIGWTSGSQSVTVAASKIDHIRINTRLDFSLKVTVVMQQGKLRMPYDCVPPAEDLTRALEENSYDIKRTHFSLIG